MKVVAFNGSPRKNGNTSILINKVLEPIKLSGIETEQVHIGAKSVQGCLACGKCIENKNSRCANDKDIVNSCITKMIEADGIIFGSPTYFAGMTPELKALIDRAGFVSFANGSLFARKIGAGVIAVRRGGATSVLDSINHMFLISQMIIPGSLYWNFGVGLEPGDVLNDEEGLRNMQNLGENIAWLIKTIKK